VLLYHISYSKDRQKLRNSVDDKKGQNGNLFLKLVIENFFRPPKLGAKSPPLVATPNPPGLTPIRNLQFRGTSSLALKGFTIELIQGPIINM